MCDPQAGCLVILGINTEGRKEVLTISAGDNESSKYWLSVLNELKNRGVKDILILCADGLTGMKRQLLQHFRRPNISDASSIRSEILWNTFRIKTGKLLQLIWRQFTRQLMRRKRRLPLREWLRNGLPNIWIQWNAGKITGMPSLQFSSFLQPSERSFIQPMPLNRWIRRIGNPIVKETYFQVIQHC